MNLASVIKSESETVAADLRPPEGAASRAARASICMTRRARKYLDFLSGIGVNALGHAHPAIQAVLNGKRES